MSSLMGLFQKKKYMSFLSAVAAWRADDKSTWGKYMDPKNSMASVFAGYGLDANTQDFTGHAIALWRDDSYKERSCAETIVKCQLYAESLARYGSSPYLYPLYGLGELPQGFARLSAIYGGTYMLNRPIEGFEFTEGKVTGVKAPDPDDEAETVKTVACDMVIGDPSYFPDKVQEVGRVARAILILDHPLPDPKGTHPSGGAYSTQIIIPANQIKPAGSKKEDVYVCAVSDAHNVAAPGHWIAIVSTQVESSDPMKELSHGIRLCGPVLESFVKVDKMFAPVADGTEDGVFITTSYDATTHFETTFDDINDVYRRVTGKELDLSQVDESGADGGGGEAQ